MNTFVLWLGIAALLVAVVLYFVFLPHVEGPSLDEQAPDYKEWLVQCPSCQRWRLRSPVTTNRNDPDRPDEKRYANWYQCRECGHRWHEEYR